MIFLAEIGAPNPLILTAVLGSLFFLAAGVNQVAKFLDRFKEKPPVSQTYATKAELAATKAEMKAELHLMKSTLDRIEGSADERRRAIYEKIETLRMEIKGDTNGIHDRITEVLSGVSELRGEMRIRTGI